MKKKIFLALAISALLVCLFAVGVSAVTGSTSNEYGTVTEVEGLESLANTYKDHDSRVVLKNADGTFTTYPSYYIYNGSTGSNMRIDMSTLNTALSLGDDEMYTSASVVRVEVFADASLNHLYSGCSSLIDAYLPEGVWLHHSSFYGCSSLTTISLPESCTSIPQSAFQGCSSLTSIKVSSKMNALGGRAFQSCSSLVRVELPETVTSIPQDGFHGCSSLEYINIPRDCTFIGNYAFNGCSKVLIDLSNAKSLKSTGSNNNYGVTTSLVFPEGFESFGGINSSNVTSIVFPNSTTSIGVIKCSNLKEIVMPAGLTSLCNKQFDYCGSLEKVTIPMGVTSISTTGNTSFFGCKPSTIVFTGSEDAEVLASIKAVLPNATIEFANHCDVYYNSNHDIVTEEGNTCSGVCKTCGYFKLLADPIHTNDLVLAFGTGVYTDEVEEKTDEVNYYANMYILHVCKYCETEVAEADEYGAIFENLGISATETDDYSITFGISINYNALEKYEEMTGTTLQYGVVVSAAPSEAPITVVDGKATVGDSTVAADMTGAGYANIETIIRNIKSATLELNCCGYVVDSNGVITYLNYDIAEGEAKTVSWKLINESFGG